MQRQQAFYGVSIYNEIKVSANGKMAVLNIKEDDISIKKVELKTINSVCLFPYKTRGCRRNDEEGRQEERNASTPSLILLGENCLELKRWWMFS